MPAITIRCYSQSAIGRIHSNIYNGKSIHIRNRHNTIRQLLPSVVVAIDYVKSNDNIADPLTKGLKRDQVDQISKEMDLKLMK